MAKGTLTVKACSVDECGKRAIGRGWCAMHYSRWRHHGDIHHTAKGGQTRPRMERVEGGSQCPFCHGWYVNRSKLGIHLKRLHNDAMPVECPSCDRRFMDDRGKQTHMGYAHPTEIGHRRNDPVAQREWNLRTNYGIGIEDYDRMLRGQGGTCATCEATAADQQRGRLNVDHCHETGRVRGLLCANCNRAIGLAADSPDRLRRMATYLDGGDV